MNNKIIGLFTIFIFGNGTIAFALFFEGAAGGLGNFLSMPSFLYVIGVGGGLNHMRKHTIKDNELGKSLRSDFILAGWLGFLTGLILMLGGFSIQNLDNLAGGFAAVSVTILYGYFIGAISEAFLTK